MVVRLGESPLLVEACYRGKDRETACCWCYCGWSAWWRPTHLVRVRCHDGVVIEAIEFTVIDVHRARLFWSRSSVAGGRLVSVHLLFSRLDDLLKRGGFSSGLRLAGHDDGQQLVVAFDELLWKLVLKPLVGEPCGAVSGHFFLSQVGKDAMYLRLISSRNSLTVWAVFRFSSFASCRVAGLT